MNGIYQWATLLVVIVLLFIMGNKYTHVTAFNAFSVYLLLTSFFMVMGLYFLNVNKSK